MFLLNLLFLKWNNYVKNYSDYNITSYLQNKAKTKPLMIFISNSFNARKYHEQINAFNNAAKEGHSYSLFGFLDAQNGKRTIAKYGIEEFPKIVLYYNSKFQFYKGEYRKNAILKFIATTIKTNVDIIDESWLTLKDDYIALFYKRYEIPICFSIISSYYDSSKIKFGFSSDEDIFEQFNIDYGPKLLISINGNKTFIPNFSYNDINFENLQSIIEQNFLKRNDEL